VLPTQPDEKAVRRTTFAALADKATVAYPDAILMQAKDVCQVLAKKYRNT